jgi:hypothetical protein
VFALILENVFFTHEIFRVVNPFLFPPLLTEILELEARVKD